MNTLESIRTFFGWCSVLNIGLLMISSVCLVVCRGWISGIHKKMFALDEADLAHAYFRYLATYKVLILVFNVIPYIALRIMV